MFYFNLLFEEYKLNIYFCKKVFSKSWKEEYFENQLKNNLNA